MSILQKYFYILKYSFHVKPFSYKSHEFQHDPTENLFFFKLTVRIIFISRFSLSDICLFKAKKCLDSLLEGAFLSLTTLLLSYLYPK